MNLGAQTTGLPKKGSLRALNANLPQYVTAEHSRHGTVCIYYRRIGETGRVRMREEPFSPEFWQRYAAFLAGALPSPSQKASRPERSSPATWRWLCEQYFGSFAFLQLQPRGQGVRRRMLEETWHELIGPNSALRFADFPVAKINMKAVQVLRDRKCRFETRHCEDGSTETVQTNIEAANSRLKYIRGVLSWGAVWHGDLVVRNWAKDVPYLKNPSEGWHKWTLDELAQYEERHPIGTKARLVLGLGLYGGQRRGDIARMGRVQERSGVLQIKQEKNRRTKPITAWVPIVPPLQRIIDASETGDLFYVVQRNGRPYAKESLGNLVKRWCREAGLPHCSLHGLRKACVVRLIMDGCTPHEIMSVTGHRTLKEIDRYAREFMREEGANAVREKWLAKHGEH